VVAYGLSAELFVLDRSIGRLSELQVALGGRASAASTSTLAIEELVATSDRVIGGSSSAERAHPT
jgi:alanine dehydrogenase